MSGENDPETLESYLHAVYKACTERGFSAVLIEEDLSGPSLSPADVYRVISKASAFTSPMLNRIAYIDINPDHSPGIIDLGETVARDRGVNIQVFTNVVEAAHWLKSP